MQYLLLIYENEQRYAKGYPADEIDRKSVV